MKTDAQYKGLLNNEALFNYLKELNGTPYKTDFKRWHQLLYACHYATEGEGLPAFVQWCSMSLNMIDTLDDVRECWREVDENDVSYSLYNTQHLAVELAKQGKVKLKDRLVLDEPERIRLKLRQLVNNISTRDKVVECINAFAEIDVISPFDLYEAHLAIKQRTEIPVRILEQMYVDAVKLKKKNLAGALHLSTKGNAKPTLSNFTYFCRTQGIDILINHMTHDISIRYQGEEIEELHLLDLLNGAGFSGFGSTLHTMVRTLSRDNAGFHPVANWLEGHKWDGVDRIAILMTKLNVRRCPHDLQRIYLTRWLLGGIDAVYSKQGLAKQSILVLHGRPACGKTTFFESLVPDAYRREWFIPNIKQPWDIRFNKKQATSWLAEINNFQEVLLKGHGIIRTKFQLPDVTNYLDTDHDRYDDNKTISHRMFYGAGITTTQDQLPFALDRHYFVLPIHDIKFNLEIDAHQLWLQIKQLYDDGQRHLLLKSELKRHNEYGKVLSTHPHWITNRKQHA